METHILPELLATKQGARADDILRSCVHCGFCQATCPTYQVLGDELDSPRGRIYLIKQVLEGGEVTAKTRQHLDQCLTCRNCETTCPSGVKYGELIDIGRSIVEQKTTRSWQQRALRTLLKEGLTSPFVKPAFALGRMVKPLLPAALQKKLPDARPAGRLPTRQHPQKVLLLAGCVQPALLPSIDAATLRVLDAVGVQGIIASTLDARSGCCGALKHHMNDVAGGLAQMRANVDAWYPLLANGTVTAVVMNASGCGATVREYDHHLAHDPAYAERAKAVVAKVMDVSEYLAAFTETLKPLLQNALDTSTNKTNAPAVKAAFHPPCTLQHWQTLRPVTEGLLAHCGVALQPFAESHLCCGSAGMYSVMHPDIATELRDRKLGHILGAGDAANTNHASRPEVILSANIGCITHLQSGTSTPVLHWIEWVDQQLTLSQSN
jgi:glycolate oxidase iron-sulfur subunit